MRPGHEHGFVSPMKGSGGVYHVERGAPLSLRTLAMVCVAFRAFPSQRNSLVHSCQSQSDNLMGPRRQALYIGHFWEGFVGESPRLCKWRLTDFGL